MAKKKANGEGSIRKRDNGTWEARVFINGKSRSLYGKTQAEVRRKLTDVLSSVDNGVYVPETGMTVGQWLDAWQRNSLFDVKPSTKTRYQKDIRLYAMPAIGNVKLSALCPNMLRAMYKKELDRGLSQKSIANLHGTLHAAFRQAVEDGLLRINVCDKVKPPKGDKPKSEMHPLKDEQIPAFLEAIRGHKFEDLYLVTLFTGMRESEVVGLTWDCIDFKKGTIHLYRQLYRDEVSKEYVFSTLKNREDRTFGVAAEVLDALKRVKCRQVEWRLKGGEHWHDTNLVFTKEDGSHLCRQIVYRNFKKIAASIGMSEMRFHDLRHTYATLAVQNGVDIKTLSIALGHATVAFTLDKYCHVSDTMMRDSAERMQQYIESI